MFLHYSWLSTFCAMNTCSFHIFHVFSSLSKSLETADSIFYKYLAYVLTTPVVVIAITVAVNSVTSNGMRLGYGDIRCFVDNSHTVIFGFLVPAGIIIVLNFIFYTTTFHMIHRSPTLQSNKKNNKNLAIYVKLCTVTGIAWPFVFIDALFELSVFSFVATFFNALQGLAMFLAFVFNQRVFRLYKRLLCDSSTGTLTHRGSGNLSQTSRMTSLKSLTESECDQAD